MQRQPRVHPHPKCHTATRHLQAFTMVELLVVMAIITTLAAFGVGALRQLDLRGKQAKDASNLRQLGQAMFHYAGENDGWLPTTAHDQLASSWIYQLEPFLGPAFEKVRLSPADPRLEQKRKIRGTSYVLNEYTSVDQRTGFGDLIETYRHLRRMEAPAETITVFHASDRMGLSSLNDHTHSRNWHKGWQAMLADIQPDRFRLGKPAADNTRGLANYLYADGHLGTLEAAAVKALSDKGINIAKPPEAR